MIYFTSDLHFSHTNIITIKKRPFNDADEMNQCLITNWNSAITQKDEVYILGDVTMKGADVANNILKQLNGNKYLVKGNHDYFVKKLGFDKSIFRDVYDYKELKYNGKLFILMHYPIDDWNRKRHGSIMLHGHQHNSPEYNINNRNNGILRYDVGVDANDMKPVSIDYILEFFGIS